MESYNIWPLVPRFFHLVCFQNSSMMQIFSSSFLFMAEKYSVACIYHNFFIYSFINEHLGCSHLLAIVSSAAMGIQVHVFVWAPVFNAFGYLPRNRIAGSSGNSMFSFWETSILFFFCIPISNSQFQFAYILTNTCYFPFFLFSFFFFIMVILLGVK